MPDHARAPRASFIMDKVIFDIGEKSAPNIIVSLANANHAYFREALVTELTICWRKFQSSGPEASKDIFSDFVKRLKELGNRNPQPPELAFMFQMLQRYEAVRASFQVYKKSLMRQLLLTASDDTRLQFVAGIPSISLKRLTQAYPPKGWWWFETEKIQRKWSSLLIHGKQADSRKKRHPLLKVEQDKLQHIVRADESVLIRDEATGELALMVVRNFCPNEDVLDWADARVREIVAYKRSIRVRSFQLLVFSFEFMLFTSWKIQENLHWLVTVQVHLVLQHLTGQGILCQKICQSNWWRDLILRQAQFVHCFGICSGPGLQVMFLLILTISCIRQTLSGWEVTLLLPQWLPRASTALVLGQLAMFHFHLHHLHPHKVCLL